MGCQGRQSFLIGVSFKDGLEVELGVGRGVAPVSIVVVDAVAADGKGMAALEFF